MMRPPLRIIAAAGCAGLFPPNTLDAVRAGVATQAHIIEIDVVMTQDERLVARHDLRLNPAHDRDAAGKWVVPPCKAIKDLTYSEVCGIDVGRAREGTYYPLIYPECQPVDGARIPLVEDVVEIVAAAPTRPMLELELKSAQEDPTISPAPAVVAREVAALARRWPDVSLAVSSFDRALLDAVRAEAPSIPRFQLLSEGLHYLPQGYESIIRAVATAKDAALGVHVFDATPQVVSLAHDVGLQVMIWGLLDPFEVADYEQSGIDMLVSVRPDRVMAQTPLSSRTGPSQG